MNVISHLMKKLIALFRKLFPEIPVGGTDGGHNELSTYRHLIVCYLEFQSIHELLGEQRARQVLASHGFYQRIYQQILNDDGKILDVLLRHGFRLP